MRFQRALTGSVLPENINSEDFIIEIATNFSILKPARIAWIAKMWNAPLKNERCRG